MHLPLIKTASDIANLMPRWKSTLDPLLAGPLANAKLLPGVTLTAGSNTINHKLGQKLQGYIVVLSSAAATFFDGQNTNPAPERTLIITSSAPTTVSLLVF